MEVTLESLTPGSPPSIEEFNHPVTSPRPSSDHPASEDQPLLSDEDRTTDTESSFETETYDSLGVEEEAVVSGSSWAAYVNIICVVAGSGILGLPYAIKLGGWIALSLIVLSMLISLHTSVILIKCLYYNRNGKRLNSYGDIGFAAFGNFGRYFLVGVFNNSLLIGVPILFFILSGQSLDNIVEQIWDIRLGVRIWTVISASIVAFPFVFMKTLKETVILGVFGAATTFFTVIAIVVLSFVDLSNVVNSPNPPSHSMWAFTGFPVALASISFSFGGNNVFPHIEESMKNKKNWNLVVGLALATCAAMYALIAFAGYYVYGDNVMSPIYLNLPKGLVLTIATLFMTVHVLTTAPIYLTSFAVEAEKYLKITREFYSPLGELALRALFRTGLIVLCTGIAVIVPFFGDFMSFLGALSTCACVFVLPVVFYLKLFGWKSMSIWSLLWNLFVVVIGVIACVIGSTDAILALVRDFREMAVKH
ncbi:21178_t:CDS:2 [Gigaspora margarita]|uniref:21178_t:CDS:1 n=1 Tax=Gigaspora margarita TaxID=4874 RepID=A0ABN7UMY0_GIGMA|nr:21178_t:CDS:2 [Gigaspora margarita]